MRDFSREIAEDDAAFEHLEVITADMPDSRGAVPCWTAPLFSMC